MNIVASKEIEKILPQLAARPYPQVIKYMGSKARIIDFVIEGLNNADTGGAICDLFSGAASLAGSAGHLRPFIVNDIQAYSRVIARSYLHRLSDQAASISGDGICKLAHSIVARKKKHIPTAAHYPETTTLEKFNQIEFANRELINYKYDDKYHLFLKNYSGTWWSAEQCAWIDALREVCDELLEMEKINEGDHCILLTCVMHAMAYCGQGTGHYAQYRDAKTKSSMLDINIYRQKSVEAYFSKKFESIKTWNRRHVTGNTRHQFFALDYLDALKKIPKESLVYADPPYAFVHYSRFYHAIETFVLYDYPSLQIKGGKVVKGRYRDARHQSPFSIRSQVVGAFESLFEGVSESSSNLVLSYSNAALLDLPTMIELAHETLGATYFVEALTVDHQHMTMGRRADRMRDVEEALLIARRKKRF